MKPRMRHRRGSRPHPVERDPNPGPPMPPGTVMLVCRQTGRVISDVLEWDRSLPGAEMAEVEGWWPHGNRYAFSLDSSWCDHEHEIPTQNEIAASVAEAKRAQTVIQHRVNVKR
jgi:hypothetical protein